MATLATGVIGCEPDNPENTENPEESVKPGGGNDEDKTEPDGGENPPEEVLPETLGDMICGEWHHESEDGTTILLNAFTNTDSKIILVEIVEYVVFRKL